MEDELLKKILIFHETIWDRKASGDAIKKWLSYFEEKSAGNPDERLHALYLLSKFMYFGTDAVKEMLKALYRDLYKYPLISAIRKANNDSIDVDFINKTFQIDLDSTRFLGLGNPSESGTFLLYYFRQANCLNRNLFIHGHQIFSRENDKYTIKDQTIKHYIFIDDLCSSGSQAIQYSKEILDELKRLKPDVKVYYFTLIGLKEGVEKVRAKAKFDKVEAVFILDESFKCFNDNSRYFQNVNADYITKDFAKTICLKYGEKLSPTKPLGWADNQLLLGFGHNIPDNTLPVISSKGNPSIQWSPIFERIEKR